MLSVLYSTEKEAWLHEVNEDFYATKPTVGGRPLQIELSKSGSREIYLSVLDGAQPDMISPASSLQISMLEDLSASKFGAPLVNMKDPALCRPVVQTPLVVVAWKERAEVLWGDNPNGQLTTLTSHIANLFTDVIRLQAADPKQIRGEVPPLVQTIEQERADLTRFEQEVRNL